jgi:hypothetical protein
MNGLQHEKHEAIMDDILNMVYNFSENRKLQKQESTMAILNQKLGLLDARISDILINTGVAYCTANVLKTDLSRDVAIIVAIDTVFRIGISILLSSIRMTSKSNSDVIQLFVLGLPIATQPLSVWVARTYFRVKPPTYISTLGYLSFSWRINLLHQRFSKLAES